MTNNRSRVDVLGCLVDCGSPADMVGRIARWAGAGESRYVCFSNVHSVITLRRDNCLREALAAADLVAPDGAPVAWFMRRVGVTNQRRVPGPDLMLDICTLCAREGLAVGFLGSSPETLDSLTRNLGDTYAGLRIVYTCSPPYRALTEAEAARLAQEINASGCAVLFVGLGCPKQETWMLHHRGTVNAVMLGVGAAFDFHAGLVRRAPEWMRKAGLEWAHRLLAEPGRLWKRYLVTNSRFLVLASWALLRRHNRTSPGNPRDPR